MAHYLTVYQPIYKKIRVGKDFDGGYIICDIGSTYDSFISGGICDDISFEQEFLKQNPNLTCLAYDAQATVESTDPRLQIIKKNLGHYASETTSNLSEIFSKNSNIFLKLDIEGGEDDLFASLSDHDLTKIKQLVIEFHSAHQYIIPMRLARTHWLVHLHPNNWCGDDGRGGVTPFGSIMVPNTFECTYIRKNPGENFKFNSRPIPDPDLDQPNVPSRPVVKLDGPPYVWDF